MESFKEIIIRLTTHKDRHIKGGSMYFLDNLQAITDFIEEQDNKIK